jgi:exopolyphosphatase/guanosine-5'-triphosphate,3'-diphosphate pyrophosphatase
VASDAEHLVIAALDIGTNSFHMVIAKPVLGGFEVIAREKETVRIGHGADDMNELAPDAIDRGIACLARMRKIADSHGAEIRAVATSAVREAKNRAEFLRRARKEAGIDVEVISGVEEARLIHLGALHGIGEPEKTMFLCDIGGGSTEIVLGNEDEEMIARSFKLGAVRLTDRFFVTATLHPSAVGSCRSYVRSTLMVLQSEMAEMGYEIAVASSGTAETVAKLINARADNDDPKTMNRFQFSGKDISETVALLASVSTIEERQKLFKLEKSRAEIILAGAIIFEAISDVFGISTFLYSDYALREGLLIDTLQRRGLGPQASEVDAAMRSVRLLADRCDDRPDHSQHVARIALQLFDLLHTQLGVDDSSRRILEAGALLANVGVVISHSKHHLHSYYVIRNSELVGLSDREIELIAQVARYHRKGLPKPEHKEFAALDTADQHVVRALAGILRIAVGLDRTQDGRVKKISAEFTESDVNLVIVAAKKLDNELNEFAANERRSLLAEVLGLRVKISAS